MARSARTLCFTLLPYLSLGGVMACGGGHGPERQTPAEDQPEAGPVPSAEPPATPLLEPSDEAALPDAGTIPARCVPSAAADEPDDDFTDTNCDGIDGDAKSAVFVAPTGSDAAPGTMDAPMQTLGKAVEQAAASGKVVYVCDAAYAENVTLDHVAVSLYGGYNCADGWRRERDRAIVNPPKGVPLVIGGVEAPVVIEWLAFRAQDASGPSESSVAASVYDSKNVRFVHAQLTAGNGGDGTNGAYPAILEMAPLVGGSGHSVVGAGSCGTSGRGDGVKEGDPVACASHPAGGRGSLSECPDGVRRFGGLGGSGGNFALGLYAEGGDVGLPVASASYGTLGASGVPGAPGGAFGAIESGLYGATNGGGPGGGGRAGAPGRGGAGGDSYGGGSPMLSYPVGGGGGQGGYGGCGGFAGRGGTAGGASIALVADGSGVALDACLLITGRGGHGGTGSEGGSGQPGGEGGPGGLGSLRIADGHPGGKGGDGGKGGTGGPGGGGPSVAIAFRGNAPSTAALSYSLGEPGLGGTSSGATAPSGVSAETYGTDSPADAGK